MRLTQIKLAGFKSFVDPTAIPTPSQLVGVVGPNGCGKSNIIDAVRWVLGETRASELRGESMQDVIFNGSGQRKPAARASVELVFDNSAGRAAGQWSAYAEIAVRRVLTRDGNSSYLVNNQAVRRRDVHDIFLGTGLGVRGYAIVGQGMINRLIEARPEELRVFLEEAAGVSRYRERRRETENRLGDTRENVARIEDIQREQRSHLDKLEAQAEVAGRYRALRDEGRRKQQALWYLAERAALADRRQKAEAIEQAQAELDTALADLRASEAALETRRQAHYAAADAVHAIQGELFEAGAQVSRLETEIRHVVEARERMRSRSEQLQQQVREWDEQTTGCADQIERAQVELAAAQTRGEELGARADDARAALLAVEDRVRAAAEARDTLRRAVAAVERDLALAGQTQHDSGRQLEALDARRERLEQRRRELDVPDGAEVQRVASELAVLDEQLEQARQQLLALERQLPSLDQQRAAAHAAARDEAAALARLDARLAALSKLQDDVQKRGALGPWLDKHGLSTLETLWRKLRVDPGWEPALEAVLRERIGALEVHELDRVGAFADTEMPPARLAFYQLPPTIPPLLPQSALVPLATRLHVDDARLRALLADWLTGVYAGDGVADALARRGDLPPGGCYIVKEGHLVDRQCVRFYAPDSEQAGLLARQREIEYLRREVKAARLVVDEAVGQGARAEAAWREVSDAMAPARTRVGELTGLTHDLQLRHVQLTQRASQSTALASRLAADLTEIAREAKELAATREESEARFEQLDADLAEHQSRFAEAQAAGENLAAEAERSRLALRDAERAAQECEFAARSQRARIDDLTRNQALAREQGERARAELESLRTERSHLDETASRAGLQEALTARVAIEARLGEARVALGAVEADLRHVDEQRVVHERSLEPRRARITELQLAEQAARLTVEQFAAQLDAGGVNREELSRTLAQRPDAWRRAEWLEAEVRRIERLAESLGPVNLAALDELEAARERGRLLDSQYEDLTAAIQTLEDAIRRIDRETRALLRETFDTVNEHFGVIFPRLFGGGRAKLSITGEEILDAGVLVMAQPPGKRNSTIHLLSGGEKALTAIALVFALFKLNPAPFCLLDEVDAPLDDANTERYAKLVESMSDRTQFLFISHNRIAMRMAKQLVGVTMQEEGVSRVVAVDIESALEFAEA